MNPGSRRSSTSSNISSASIVGQEYSSMMEEWVDDCWMEMEVQMMVLDGNEFKHLALAPYDAASRKRTECRGASAEDEGTDTAFGPVSGSGAHARRRADPAGPQVGSRARGGSRSYSHYAALARRNSERCAAMVLIFACHVSAFFRRVEYATQNI